jgi:hypothetical protein
MADQLLKGAPEEPRTPAAPHPISADPTPLPAEPRGASPAAPQAIPALPPVAPGADLGHPPLSPRWIVGICLVTFVVYLLFVPRFLRYSSPPTGDQPFYLLDTISLVQDGDLELSNNYANHDEDKFYSLAPHPPDFVGMPAPYPLPRQLAVAVARPDEELYSYHAPGLGVLLVPAWIIGAWFSLGWPATVVFMCLIGALIAANVFLLAYETTGRRGVALAVWAAMAFSGPLMSYSYMIFTELPTGLAVIYAFRRLARGWRDNGPIRLLLIGLCIGCIPWLAVRCAPIAAGLGLYAAVQWWRAVPAGAEAARGVASRLKWPAVTRHVPRAIWLVAPVLVLGAGLAAYHIFLNGNIFPPPDEREGSGVGWIYWPWESAHNLYLFLTGAFGLLFSARFGLLPYAPIYLLAVVGAVAMCRTARPGDRHLVGWIGVIALPYLGFIAAYSGWTGDWGPPARYPSTLLPLLAAPLALGGAVLARSWVYRAVYGLLTGIGFAAMAVMLYDARTMFATEESAVFTWLAEDPASPLRLDLRPLFPHFITPDETWFPYRMGWPLVAGSLIILLGVFLLWRQRTALIVPPRWPVRARAALVLSSLALLGVAWGIVSYDFLRPKTALNYVASWSINAPLDTAGGIAYLGGKVYIALYGQRGDQEVPGTVGVFDVNTASYATMTPVVPDGAPLAWTHPGSVAVGPDGLLYVLNNGPDDQALLALQPDGQVVRRLALEDKSVVGMGLFFDDEGDLYIADQLNGVIYQYDSQGGKPLATLTGKEDILNNPRGVAVDTKGNIYTTETFNRIQKLDSQGNVNTIYELNCRPRYFAAPPEAGPWLEASCSTGLVSLNTAENYVQFTHITGDAPPPDSPRGIAYGPDDRLYVLDGNTLFVYTVTH